MKRDVSVPHGRTRDGVAFTPKGGCPLKLRPYAYDTCGTVPVAFTPKGGCPLKLVITDGYTNWDAQVAFTPKGGCPLKQNIQRAC